MAAENNNQLDLEKQTSSKGTSLHDDQPGEKAFHEGPFAQAADAEARPDESKPAPPSFANVPDGGVVAWTQVACSYFLFFNTW